MEINEEYVIEKSLPNGYEIRIFKEQYVLVDNEGTQICTLEFDNIHGYSCEIIRASLDGYYFFFDLKGKKISECRYLEASDFYNGLAIVTKNDRSHYTCINKHGIEILPAIYSDISFSKKYIYGIRDGYAELIDKSGNTILGIEHKYLEIKEHESGNFIVKKGYRNYEFITITGAVIFVFSHIPQHTYEISKYDKNLLVAKERDHMMVAPDFTYYNIEGHSFSQIFEISEDMRLVRNWIDGRYGYLNGDGLLVIPCKFYTAYKFVHSQALVEDADGVYLIDKSGEIIKKLKKYDRIEGFKNGYARVSKNQLWGFIDESGFEICKTKYNYVLDFNNDLALVKCKHHWGLIDKNGKLVIQCKYYKLTEFSNDIFLAERWNYKSNSSPKKGLINKNGIVVLPVVYDIITNFSDGMAKILNYKIGKYGYVDYTGTRVIDEIYDNAYSFENGEAGVCLNEEWFVINKKGEKIKDEFIPPADYSNYGTRDDDDYARDTWFAMNGY